MENIKKNKAVHRLACAVLALTIALSAIAGVITSAENVAKADYIEYAPSGQPIYTVSRLTIPVTFEDGTNSDIGWISLGLKILPYNETRHQVNFYTYYYMIHDEYSFVAQGTPYPYSVTPVADTNILVGKLALQGTIGGDLPHPINYFVPFCYYTDSNFVGNVHYVEIGSSYLDGPTVQSEVLGSSRKSAFDNKLGFYTYIKYTQFDGAVFILALKLADSSSTDVSFLNSSTPYRKYYTLSVGDLNDSEQYLLGKQQGLAEGYQNGLSAGSANATQEELDEAFRNGYQQAINDEAGDLGTFAGWGEAVLDMLNVPIFGTFGIGTIIALVAGLLLVLGLLNLLRG